MTTEITIEGNPTQWWVEVSREATGPYSAAFVTASILAGTLSGDQLVCPVGGEEWKPLKTWPQFRGRLPHAELDNESEAQAVRTPPPLPVGKTIDWVQIGAVHGLIVNPILWCLGVALSFGGEMMLAQEAPSYAWSVLLNLFEFVANSVLMVGWLLSGWWLYCRQPRGLWMTISTCIASNLLNVTMIAAFVCLAFASSGEPVPESSKLELYISGLVFAVGILEWAFQNVLAINLWLQRNAILSLCQNQNLHSAA